MKIRDLTSSDCKDVMSKDLFIGSKLITTGERCTFKYNPWRNEYIVSRGDEVVMVGQAHRSEEFLDFYNNL